jgi:hypothetical protein
MPNGLYTITVRSLASRDVAMSHSRHQLLIVVYIRIHALVMYQQLEILAVWITIFRGSRITSLYSSHDYNVTDSWIH